MREGGTGGCWPGNVTKRRGGREYTTILINIHASTPTPHAPHQKAAWCLLKSFLLSPPLPWPAQVVKAKGTEPDQCGFYLPAMSKHDLFLTVILNGVLPRKTFSMGHADEKRFYFECRAILP